MSGGFMPKGTGTMSVEVKEAHPAWKHFEKWLSHFPQKADVWTLYWSAFCEGWKAAQRELTNTKAEVKDGREV